MKIRNRNWWIATSSVVILLVLYLISPQTTISSTPAPSERASAYAFGDTRSIGQSFTPLPGLHTIRFPIGTDGAPSGPLLLHIRKTYLSEDLRTAVVFRPEEEEAVFTFTPLRTHEDLVWVLEGPNDPDRSYLVNREVDDSAQPTVTAYIKGAPIKGNFGFTQEGTITLFEHIMQSIRTNQGWYRIEPVEFWALGIAAVAAICVWFMPRVSPTRSLRLYLLAGIVVATFVTHFFYAQYLAFINDEGAYIQDAIQSTGTFWPLRDFLTKGPLYIGILKVWLALVPNDPVIVRSLSAIGWIGGCLCLYFLVKVITRRAWLALAATAAMALSPAVVAATTPLLLQVMSTAIGVGALVVTIEGSIRRNNRKHMLLLGIGGFAMVAAYLTRASSVVYALVGLLLVFYYTPAQKMRAVGWYVGSGLLAAAVIAVLSGLLIGWNQTIVFFNLEAFLIAGDALPALQVQEDTVIRQWVEGGRLLWRGAPWLISGFLTSIILLARVRSKLLNRILAFGILLVLVAITRAWQDMGFHVPSPSVVTVSFLALIAFGPVFLILGQLVIGREVKAFEPSEKTAVILSLVWIAALAFIYGSWFRFIDSYIVEFIPPLAILLAVSGKRIHESFVGFFIDKRRGTAVAVLVLITGIIVGSNVLIKHPHTGTITLRSLRASAALVSEVVPPNEPIFTAQSSITAFANRPILFGYSHSGWYLYERRGLVAPTLRQLFFQEPAAITEYLRNQAKFVLMDDRTKEVYFNNYPDREAILANQFELITSIDNPASQPIDLYARITAD